MEDTEENNIRNADSSEVANGDQQSVVSRVGNLPLVSSACGVVSTAYSTTKDSVPLLKGVMDVAESGVRTLGAAASTGSKPILDRLEPQLSAVNEYAMMGLDKMEQNLPILQQPANKLVSDTMGMMYQSVFGAKDAMMGAVMGGVEMTRAAVSGGLSTVMGTRVGQMVSSGVGLVLTRSEDWVEHNLPLSEKELADMAEPGPSVTAPPAVTDTQAGSSSYFVRLGKLSSTVQERALQLSLQRAQRARDASYTAVSQISSTLDLLETARSASHQLGGAPEQLLQHWREWSKTETEVDGGQKGEIELEGRTLSMLRGLSDQLFSACSGVVSSAQGLPGVVQDQLANARRAAEDLQSSLGKATSLTPVLLDQTRKQLKQVGVRLDPRLLTYQVQHSLDGVMEYLLNNTPLNWLVGPFAPQVTEKGEKPL